MGVGHERRGHRSARRAPGAPRRQRARRGSRRASRRGRRGPPAPPCARAGPTAPAAPGAASSSARPSRSRPRWWNQRQTALTIAQPGVGLARARATSRPRRGGCDPRGRAGASQAERIRPEHPGPGRGGDRGAQRDEPRLDGLPLAGLLEPLERVLAQQRMQAEAGLAAAPGASAASSDEALVGERLEAVERRRSRGSPSGSRPRARPRRPAAREHAEPANRRRSSGDRRSWLHAIAPRSVRCRSGRSRAPPPRSRLRSSRSRICAGRSSRTRAAASSRASGSPPSRSRDRPHGGESRRRRGRGPGARPVARSMNSATPASTSSGGTGCSCSPEIRSSSRLVTSTRSSGAPRTEVRDALGAGRQQLLEVVEDEQRRRSRRWTRRASSTVRSVDSRMPSDAATEGSRRAASLTAARSTNHDAVREPVADARARRRARAASCRCRRARSG